MKIIDRGLVGKQVSCPRCQCISELEAEDTWQQRRSHMPPEMHFYVSCPQCSCEIVIVKEIWIPLCPNGSKIDVEVLNFV